MKKQYFLSIVLTIILTAVSYGQDSNHEENLLGIWQFEYSTSVAVMTDQSKEHYLSIPEDQKKRIKKAYQNRKVVYNQDKSYKQVLQSGKQSTGSWQLTKDKTGIVITNNSGDVLELVIEHLDDTTMIVYPKVTGDLKPLFPKWHYQKINN